MNETGCRIGVDIGGTNIKIGKVVDGKILKRKIIPTRAEMEPEDTIKRLVTAIKEIAGKKWDIEKVGIGCAGLVDHKEGIIRTPPNLPKWHNLPLKAMMETELLTPTFVGNDANACALGEYYYGLGKGKRDIFVLTIGTGVGGGIISQGRLILGSSFAAGEFGHTIIFPEGRRCKCGNRGCLEAYIGQENIIRMAKRQIKRKKSILKNFTEISPREIGYGAKMGDNLALKVIERVGYYLGIALINVIHLLDPEIIIIGGGQSKMGKNLLTAVNKTVAQRIMKLPERKLAIKISRLGSDAGILGATKLPEAFLF